MDFNSIGVSSAISAVITFLYHILVIMNGKMIHSKCCDHDIEMGVEVIDMPHKKDNVVIENDRTGNQSDSKRDTASR